MSALLPLAVRKKVENQGVPRRRELEGKAVCKAGKGEMTPTLWSTRIPG